MRPLLICCLMMLLWAVMPAYGHGAMQQDDASSATARRDAVKPPEVLADPDGPLDERISADEVTEYDPPPLPQRVVIPLPPTFRIASDPSQLPVDGEHFEKARAAISRGLAFLRQAQDDSGGWMTDIMAAPTDGPDKPSPIAAAVTALALKAIMQAEPQTQEYCALVVKASYVPSPSTSHSYTAIVDPAAAEELVP